MGHATDSVELAQALAHGDDPLAAEELYSRYRSSALRLASGRMSDRLKRRVDPEDVYQSVWIVLMEGLRGGQFKVRQTGDLWRLLRKLTDNRVRKKAELHSAARRSMLSEETGDAGLTATDGGGTFDVVDLIDEIHGLLNRISNPRHREVVRRALAGDSVVEIARRTRYSQARVRQVLTAVTSREWQCVAK